jgi:TonB family protein
VESATRRTGPRGSGLGRPLAWSLAIHAVAFLLFVPPDATPDQAQSPQRTSARLLNARRQPATSPHASLSPVPASGREVGVSASVQAIVRGSSGRVALASSSGVKSAALETATAPGASEAAVAEPTTNTTLREGKPLPSTVSPTLAPAMNEAPGPDQVLAENQYRLAVGLEAKRFRRYPPLAREMGWEGTVEVVIALNPRLDTPSISLVTTSGHGVLDREAIALLTLVVGRVQASPLLVDRQARIRITIEYRLED